MGVFGRPCPSQGKEIIEFYLNELEVEGVVHVPRWNPPTRSLPRPTSLSTSPAVIPKHTGVPALCAPDASDAKDGTGVEAKQDGAVVQADSLTEILAGTPEGLFTAKQQNHKSFLGKKKKSEI